MLYFLFLF